MMHLTFRNLLFQPSNTLKLLHIHTTATCRIQQCPDPNRERTMIMVKPDGVDRMLIGKIIARLERRGFKLIAIKIMHACDELIGEHYQHIRKKPFYPELLAYIKSGPVVPMVWEGRDIIEASRQIIGKTVALKSAPGTIRGDFYLDKDMNLLHGSSSVADAKKEIDLWFKPDELLESETDCCE